MNIRAIFTRKDMNVDLVRNELMEEMQNALRSFTTALQKYEAYTESSVAYSQMLFAEVEVHRERYRLARLAYEQAYGNLTHYDEKLDTVLEWRKERNLLCLFTHPKEQYTLAKQIS